MNTTIITENNYFENVENPIKTTTNGIVEILKPITKSDIVNVYYKVDEQLSKQKKGKKLLKKLVNAPNVFINHDYTKKVIKKTENENFVSEELKGRSVYSSSLLISDKTNEVILRGIFEHKFMSGTPKVKTYIYNGEPTETLKFGQELTASEGISNELWTPAYYNPTPKNTIGRGSVSEEENCSFVQPYISRIKFIKIQGKWYENTECE
jgi:hypothetical protein